MKEIMKPSSVKLIEEFGKEGLQKNEKISQSESIIPPYMREHIKKYYRKKKEEKAKGINLPLK